MKTSRKNMKFIGAQVPESTDAAFAVIAAANHRTKSDHLRMIIAEAIDANADILAAMPKRKTKTATR